MTSKFWFLTKQSLNKKVKTKWFLFANLLLLVVLVGIINMDSIISFFGGDFSSDIEIVLLDETKESKEIFEQNLTFSKETLDLDNDISVEVYSGNLDKLKEELKENDKIGIVLEKDNDVYMKAKIISDTKIDTMSYQLLVQALNQATAQVAMKYANIDPIQLQKITSNVEIERLILDTEAKTDDEAMSLIMGTVFPTVILPFFMLVIFLVQMIGTEINEEKTTKSMEIIISNVSPKTHFFSKVLASNVFVLMQGALLLIYGGIGLLVKTLFGTSTSSSSLTSTFNDIWNSLGQMGIMDRLPEIIISALVLMILSFIAYSLIAGILASMTVNMEDFQQIQTPIMMVCLLGYYLSIMAGVFNGSIFIRVLSYVPFISCLLSPALLVIGQIGIFDVLISVLFLIITIWIMIKYGFRVYKVGILNYSTDKMWKRLWNATKQKG